MKSGNYSIKPQANQQSLMNHRLPESLSGSLSGFVRRLHPAILQAGNAVVQRGVGAEQRFELVAGDAHDDFGTDHDDGCDR